jgi:hypothetical protein
MSANDGSLILTGECAFSNSRACDNGCVWLSAHGADLCAGMCHRAERTNINRRFYSKTLLDREVGDFTSQARPPHRGAARRNAGPDARLLPLRGRLHLDVLAAAPC